MTAPQRLLWLGAFAFFLSFFLLLAVLPLYARAVGVGDRAIGGVLGAFAFASMLMRPWAGWAADRHGRRPLMLAGGLVFVVASLAYNVTAGAFGLLAVRVLHGCGMGLYPTAASAVVADLAPPDRRGAVMGTFGAAANIAMALGPIAGIAITDRLGFVSVFWLAGCVAAVAVLLTRRLPETARRREKIPFTPGAMVSVEALVPSAVLFLVMLGYGALVTFLPIRARDQDVNPGLFFLVFALVVTAVRNYAGRLSDRLGRVAVAVGGLWLAAAALAALAVARGAGILMAAGVLYGAGLRRADDSPAGLVRGPGGRGEPGPRDGYLLHRARARHRARIARRRLRRGGGRLRADLLRCRGHDAHRRGARVEPPASTSRGRRPVTGML